MSLTTTDRSSRCTTRRPRAGRPTSCRGVRGPLSPRVLRPGTDPAAEGRTAGVDAGGRVAERPTSVVAVPLVPGGPSARKGYRDGGWPGADAGMATAEYAIATLAACGFAGLLLAILASDQVRALLLGIVQRALSVG